MGFSNMQPIAAPKQPLQSYKSFRKIQKFSVVFSGENRL